jgi:hypothetical protein
VGYPWHGGRAAHDAAQLLGIEVDQTAREGVLVADHHGPLRGLAHEALAVEHPVDRRGRQLEQRPDAFGTPAGPLAQAHDVRLGERRQPPRTGARARAAVEKATLALGAPTWQPAVVEAPTDTERGARGRDRHTRLDRLEDLGPAAWRQGGIGVTMHRGALPVVELVSALNLAGDGLLVVTNVVAEQT